MSPKKNNRPPYNKGVVFTFLFLCYVRFIMSIMRWTRLFLVTRSFVLFVLYLLKTLWFFFKTTLYLIYSQSVSFLIREYIKFFYNQGDFGFVLWLALFLILILLKIIDFLFFK